MLRRPAPSLPFQALPPTLAALLLLLPWLSPSTTWTYSPCSRGTCRRSTRSRCSTCSCRQQQRSSSSTSSSTSSSGRWGRGGMEKCPPRPCSVGSCYPLLAAQCFPAWGSPQRPFSSPTTTTTTTQHPCPPYACPSCWAAAQRQQRVACWMQACSRSAPQGACPSRPPCPPLMGIWRLGGTCCRAALQPIRH